MPAAFAARTPFGESSNTTASSAATSRTSSASRYIVGLGFARSSSRSAVMMACQPTARSSRAR